MDANIPHCQSVLEVLTISIGVAESNELSWQELIKEADKALYQAKEEGRNRVIVANQ
jgi:diguanylate cyclase (GGDEF)-like protein